MKYKLTKRQKEVLKEMMSECRPLRIDSSGYYMVFSGEDFWFTKNIHHRTVKSLQSRGLIKELTPRYGLTITRAGRQALDED